MKFKKKIAALVAGALSVFTLAGCSETTLNYSNELSKASNFEAAESTMNGNMAIEAGGQKFNININGTGYCTKDGDTYVKLDYADPSGLVKMPEMEMYLSGSTLYYNKSFFTGLYTKNGLAVPEKLKSVNTDYIAIESPYNAQMAKSMQLDPDALAEMAQTIFGKDSKLDLPIVQNGREFTLDMDSDKMIDLLSQAIKDGSANLDNLNKQFSLNLKDEDIAALKEAIASADYESGIKQIKDMLKGSSLKMKTVFADDSYNQNIDLILNIQNQMKVTMNMAAQSKKCNKRNFAVPTSVTKMTQEELAGLMTQNVKQTEAMAHIAA